AAEPLKMLIPVLSSPAEMLPTLLFSTSKVTVPFRASETWIPWFPGLGEPRAIVLFEIVVVRVALSPASAPIESARLPVNVQPLMVTFMFALVAARTLTPSLPVVGLLLAIVQPLPPIENVAGPLTSLRR